MPTRDDSSTRPEPDPGPPMRPGSRREAWKDFVLPIAGLVVGAAVGFGGVVYTSDQSAHESLITARRLAWASYLGTLDELDRIQPDLITDPPGPRATQRWDAAYPDSKRQAAAVVILSDDSTSALVSALQDKQLSVVDDWVQDGTWNGGRALRPDLDTTASVKRLTKAAQSSVRG